MTYDVLTGDNMFTSFWQLAPHQGAVPRSRAFSSFVPQNNDIKFSEVTLTLTSLQVYFRLTIYGYTQVFSCKLILRRLV